MERQHDENVVVLAFAFVSRIAVEAATGSHNIDNLGHTRDRKAAPIPSSPHLFEPWRRMMTTRKFICPNCKQRKGVSIVYGMPSIDFAEQIVRKCNPEAFLE